MYRKYKHNGTIIRVAVYWRRLYYCGMAIDEHGSNPQEEHEVLSVGELCALIKTSLEGEFSRVFVAGEISNLREYDSGHIYFTIKENKASISAVLFAGVRRAERLNERRDDGKRAYQPVKRYGYAAAV